MPKNKMKPVNVTLDKQTIQRLENIQRENPDVLGLSAAIRYAARVADHTPENPNETQASC
jgi:hypothetical protein